MTQTLGFSGFVQRRNVSLSVLYIPGWASGASFTQETPCPAPADQDKKVIRTDLPSKQRMKPMAELKGQCMCGAVRISATSAKPGLVACHCDMCRRWTSSMYMSVRTDQDSITVTGPVRVFGSSEWAERAFCDTCGSALWYATLHDGQKNLAAGLFDNAAEAELKLEFFIDKKPQGYAFVGDQRQMTEAETIAIFAPDPEAGQ